MDTDICYLRLWFDTLSLLTKIRAGYLNYMHHFKILEIIEKSKDTFVFHVQNFMDKKIYTLTIKIHPDKSLSINNLLDLSINYVLGVAEGD